MAAAVTAAAMVAAMAVAAALRCEHGRPTPT